MSTSANLIEELHPQCFLQVANLRGDCWLAKVQFFGSANKATVFRYNLKCGKLVQIECTHMSSLRGWENPISMPHLLCIFKSLVQPSLLRVSQYFFLTHF